jgi:cytochrome c-type biogenesis protein CcmH
MGSSRSSLRWACLVVAAWVLATAAALAVEPGERLADPALEARARALSTELRCLVCQNQSIDDSNAPLARDLRMLVRERLAAGSTDAEVLRFVVERYGEFVLLKPPFGWHTALLWLAPAALLALVAASLLRRYRATASAQREAQTQELTADEKARLAQLLGKDRKPG